MLQRRALILLSILLVPLLSGIFAPSFGSASAAIDDCQGTLSPIVWNETISRHAEVPFNDYWDPFYYEEDWDDDEVDIDDDVDDDDDDDDDESDDEAQATNVEVDEGELE